VHQGDEKILCPRIELHLSYDVVLVSPASKCWFGKIKARNADDRLHMEHSNS
jgi:hypothetical protein